MGMWSIILLITWLALAPPRSGAWTQKDDRELLGRGNARVLLGALRGDVSTYRQGIAEGGETDAVLTEQLGKEILRLGEPIVDFPILPALHLCMNFGDRAHLNLIFEMLNKKVNPNEYRIPAFHGDFGFAPAIFYTLGLGFQPPNVQHAAMLQRMHEFKPTGFNITAIKNYIEETGNPPLAHIPAIFGFNDGLFVLLVDLKWNVDERDAHGLTPLHVASWFGDGMTAALLLTHGADRMATDKHGRTPLHYAAMRGHHDIIEMLFIPPILKGDTGEREMNAAKFNKLKRQMLSAKDKDQRTALVLAALPPALQSSVRAVRRQMTKEKFPPGERWNRPPFQGKRSSQQEREPGESPETLGGWPLRLGGENDELSRLLIGHDDAKSDIDVVQGNTISKGVFRRDYFATQRPVLFSGQPTTGQPIWAFWRRADLIQRYGNLELFSGPPPVSSTATATTLREWADQGLSGPWDASNSEASSVLHVDFDGIPLGKKLRSDVFKPKVLQLCGPRDEENFKMTVGLAGQGTPVHAVNASWHVLLFGKKKWFLAPPGVNASEPGLLTKEGPVQPTAHWLRDHAPSLRSKGLLSEVTQFPGEVVFVPPGWHFATLNLQPSGSLSQEFCTLRHTDMRVQPLGAVVYGANESMRGFGRTKYHYQGLHLATLGDGRRSKIPNFNFEL